MRRKVNPSKEIFDEIFGAYKHTKPTRLIIPKQRKTKKKRVKSDNKKAKDNAWKWFSKYIRLRDCLQTTKTKDMVVFVFRSFSCPYSRFICSSQFAVIFPAIAITACSSAFSIISAHSLDALVGSSSVSTIATQIELLCLLTTPQMQVTRYLLAIIFSVVGLLCSYLGCVKK